MTRVLPSIFPETSLEVVISQIASLSDEAFKILKDDIESESAFDIDKVRCDWLSQALEIEPQATALLLSAISLLVDRGAALPAGASLQDALARFVDGFDQVELDVNSKKRLVARLVELTEPNPKIESWAKIGRLRVGFLDHATEFATFVDLRPDYAPDYASIRAYVPMIQFKLTTDSDDPAKREFVWQLSEEALSKLKKAVEAAQTKLETLRKLTALSAPIHFKSRAK